MIGKVVKIGLFSAAGAGLALGILFGTDAGSYVWTAAKSVRTAAKDSVPIEFELQRCRDMLEEIIPEMHANIRLIAQEEVEIAHLHESIGQSEESMTDEQARIAKLRDMLKTQQVSYTLGGFDYGREQVKEDLARRFEHFREAEVVLASKRRLVETREKSLRGAMQMLERTRAEKARLEDQVAALDSQYRLVKAASTGSRVQMDNSKLAQAEKLLGQIRTRLNVAERVLAHEAKFVQPIQVDIIDEVDLLQQVDDHFAPAGQVKASETDEPLMLSQADTAGETDGAN